MAASKTCSGTPDACRQQLTTHDHCEPRQVPPGVSARSSPTAYKRLTGSTDKLNLSDLTF